MLLFMLPFMATKWENLLIYKSFPSSNIMPMSLFVLYLYDCDI